MTAGNVAPLIWSIGCCYVAVALVSAFIESTSMKDDPKPALAVIWPLWFYVAAKRAWREFMDEGCEWDDEPDDVRVVYRYPARTWLSWLCLWAWRVGVSAAVAWMLWRMHK